MLIGGKNEDKHIIFLVWCLIVGIILFVVGMIAILDYFVLEIIRILDWGKYQVIIGVILIPVGAYYIFLSLRGYED